MTARRATTTRSMLFAGGVLAGIAGTALIGAAQPERIEEPRVIDLEVVLGRGAQTNFHVFRLWSDGRVEHRATHDADPPVGNWRPLSWTGGG